MFDLIAVISLILFFILIQPQGNNLSKIDVHS